MAPIARAVAAAATVGALLLSSAAAAPNGGREMSAILQAGGGGWSTGARATHYGGGDAISSSLDAGSCMMKIDGPKYVTAVNTAGSGNTNKCGQCYEVMCVDGPTRGMNHSRFGAPSACREPGKKAVVVMVTDSCPCVYPGNQASNSMWCCGDMFHLDLSYTAFDVIAERGKGVVDLIWRQVDCSSRKNSVTTY